MHQNPLKSTFSPPYPKFNFVPLLLPPLCCRRRSSDHTPPRDPPRSMASRATSSRFPANAEVHASSGLPWGATITPFSPTDESNAPPIYGTGGNLLPRCDNCWAYFSAYCELGTWEWSCALCGAINGLPSHAIDHYARPDECPEIRSSFVDLELPLEDGEGAVTQARPVYVAMVDLSSSEEFLELVKSALLAALEALVPGSLFGLITFSHKIGLYDVQAPVPVVKHIFISPDLEGGLPVDLEDVMPLLSFLAPVETCKDNISAAIETLKPTTSWTAVGQGLEGVLLSARGFGVAMSSLIDYLSSQYGVTFALARVFAFLSGPPDYGAGQLDTRRYGEQYASKGEDADCALLTEQTPYYKDLATIAVQSGVCVDIFSITDEYTDLSSLKFLSIESGGSLFLYSNMDESTLPQDLYRLLSRPYAFGCILRLRTSSEFKLANSYGHFFADPQYENVQHIICCDAFATYAYDFEFAESSGFSRHTGPAVLQFAFQYSVITPSEETIVSETNSPSFKFSVKRRLRIRTLQFETAADMKELYENVDSEAMLSILVHKVLLASLNEGVREGRILLRDWLVILTAQYNDTYKYVDGNVVITTSHVDVAFSQCTELQSLPRLVFALLRNPLLLLHEEGVHPDYRVYLHCLFSALEPTSLSRAIYPLLASYATPNQQAYPRHSLSRAALITSESPIFLLDAFTNIIVYYSPTADPSFSFPPPQDCLLRNAINDLKLKRNISPRLQFIRGGQDDSSVFENYLIEEQDVDGNGITGSMGFVSFLEEIKRDVVEYLR